MTSFKTIATGLYLAVAAVALSAGSAHAVLMSADDLGFGVDSITLDTDTNLEWLDLTESTNLTFAQAAAEFGAGGDFEGWRHATATEVGALFTNGGFPPPHGASPATQAMVDLIQLLGRTTQARPGLPGVPARVELRT